jgi:hypothetical protein
VVGIRGSFYSHRNLRATRSLIVLSNQLSLIRDQLDGVVDRHEENSLLNVAHDIRADVRTIAKATGADDDEDR